MAAPVPFIQVDPVSSLLVITDEARAYLNQVETTVGVVAVAGIYRTGKSFILNQLAGTTGTGFGVGNSVQAKTKGIWIWGEPLRLGPNDASGPGAPQELLLLDTEGLQSIDQTEGHDAKIFSLAILLASAFVYNSKEAINNAAIDQLSLVAQLTQRIVVRTEDGNDGGGADRLAPFFPKFTWLLRDFSLELVDVHGAAQSTDAYLEECLHPSKGTSAAIQEQNATREAIRSLFKERACIALPHPTLGTALPPSALRELDKTPLSALNADFVSGVNLLKTRLFGGARSKTLGVGGPALTGRTLLQLAGMYCDAINEGALPNISNAFTAVIVAECNRALEEGARLYLEGVATFAPTDTDAPLDVESLHWHEEHARLLESALRRFKSIAMGDGPAAAEAQAKLLALCAAERQKNEALLRMRSESAEGLSELLTADLRAVREQLDSTRAQVDLERAKNGAAEKELESLNASIAEKDKSLASMRADLMFAQNFEQKAKQLQAQVTDQSKQLQAKVDRISELTGELTTARSQIETFARAAAKPKPSFLSKIMALFFGGGGSRSFGKMEDEVEMGKV